jgi:hypothetical protein
MNQNRMRGLGLAGKPYNAYFELVKRTSSVKEFKQAGGRAGGLGLWKNI